MRTPFCASIGSACIIALLFASLPQWTPTTQAQDICPAANSFVRLSEFFHRNQDRMDADSYSAASVALMALNATQRRGELVRRVSEKCGESVGLEFERASLDLDNSLASFRKRMGANADDSPSGYDRVSYWKICRPMNKIARHLLDPRRFRWRSLWPKRDHGDSGRTASSAKSWIMKSSQNFFTYSEKVGDACYKALLDGKDRTRCLPSDSCKRIFLNSRANVGYMMTHQLMYWIASIYHSCHLRLSNGRRVNPGLLRHACRRIYSQYREILVRPATDDSMDVALEQAVFCGMLGYRDFFQDSTTLWVRRLQDERLGCLPESPEDNRAPKKAHTQSTGRKLMHSVVLEGICSTHTSGLASAYLAFVLQT